MTRMFICDRCGKTIDGHRFRLDLVCGQLDLELTGDLCEACAGWLRGSMKVSE